MFGERFTQMQRQKSIFTREYKILLATLARLREESGMTQGDVGKGMNRTQSVVSKSEVASRRMDVIEVRQYCLGIGVGFVRFAEIYEAELASGAETARKSMKRTY
jgi:hypothetical protein